MLILLLGCDGKPPVDDTDTPPVTEGFALTADARIALPFASAGDDAPEAELTVTGVGRAAKSEVRFTVDGDFAIEGDPTPLGPDEARRYMVRYIGDTSAPVIALGSVSVTAEDKSATVELVAVIGDPTLPDAAWTASSWGRQATVGLPSAPFPYGGAPYDDDSVLLFAPDGLDDRGAVAVVTHLHGWYATLDETVPAQRLVEQHALSGRNAVLVVPQGPVDAADGDFGRLEEPDGFATLLRDVVSVMYRDGLLTWPAVGDVALTAHSGGYGAAASILRDGGVDVSAVHLFDAMYGERDVFAAFAEGGGVLRSVYTATGGTDAENLTLRDELEAAGLAVGARFDDDALVASAVTIGPTDASHDGCVRDDRAYARWLAASGLPRRPSSPPELVSALSDGVDTVLTWRADAGGDALHYRVEGSVDGAAWTLITDTGETSATVPATPFLRVAVTDVRHGDSAPSDVYGGTGADWLVVDAFDRVLDGSWGAPTHAFAATLAADLGAASVASNEAVAEGAVDLAAWPRVLWMLGDEGLADRTFSDREMAALSAYVEAGGALVVSGSEVGYATDPDWLDATLHASFVADHAGTTTVGDWTVGAAYPEDSPDVLAGDEVLWTWSSGAPAAVGWDHRVAVVGFGLENLDDADRAEALAALASWLEG